MKIFFLGFISATLLADPSRLMRDLDIVYQVDREINERLPFIYNNIALGGYWSMPSARVNDAGTLFIGGVSAPPYAFLNLNFQAFSSVEFSGNVRFFRDHPDTQFGDQGFGDETDRSANVKFSLLRPSDNFPFLPNFAVGWNDFYGSSRFYSFYAVMTKQWLAHNLEFTLGWGMKYIHGWFGGISWTPFRQMEIPFIKDLSLLAEYDANHYSSHDEHPEGRHVNTRLNFGLALTWRDLFQIKVGMLRGKAFQGSFSVDANIGDSKGIFIKNEDPPLYYHPVNREPIDRLRSERDFGAELALSLHKQGLSLRTLYLEAGVEKRDLWMKVINTQYREEEVVRDRLQHLLGALVPDNVDSLTVALEADGVLSQEYRYRKSDLIAYHNQLMDHYEIETLSPRSEITRSLTDYDAIELYRNDKEILIFTVRPRFITFFGSTTGKLKESVGFVAGPEGYLFDEVYYKIQAAYNIYTSLSDAGDMDKLNPSQLPNVRSDAISYFRSQSVTLEQAYLQKSHNFGGSWFGRIAGGYFEPLYGGLALEFLYYPVNSWWAIGFEGAGLLKRKKEGLGFTTHVRQFDGYTPKQIPFIGNQFFVDLYCMVKRFDVELKICAGKFLARDYGARFEFMRNYKSGLQFSIWTTVTNGHDHVNGHIYYDKGIAFTIPFDFFLKKSSRTYIGNATSAWLRDVGAKAATGKPLFWTLYHERL